MKLQLRDLPAASVLSVHETVDPSDVVVLRAGLGRMAASGKRAIVLDLLAASLSGADVLPQLRALPEAMLSGGGILLLALKDADESRTHEFKAAEDALKHLSDPKRRVEHEIRLYTSWNSAIEARRTALEAELNSGDGKAQEAGKLRTSISLLRRRVRFLEARVSSWMAKAPYRGMKAPPAYTPGPPPSVDRILEILLQSGILKGLLKPQRAATDPDPTGELK